MASGPERGRADLGGTNLAGAEAHLRRVRSRARGLLLARGVGLVVGLFVLGMALVAVADYGLRTPGWLRGVVLAVGVAAALWGVWRLIIPAWRFRPSLTEVALRLERSEEARATGLAGVLASGLELARNREGASAPEAWLAERAAAAARERFETYRGRFGGGSLLRARPAVRGLAVLGLAAAVTAGCWAAWPRLSTIGATRVLAPWAGAQWPKRTAVADVTGSTVHALGTALPLRAAVVRTNRGAGETRVAARYRVVTADGAGPVRRVILNAQDRSVEAPDPEGEGIAQGELYERLIEPAALAGPAAERDPAEVAELEYWFETEDDQTEARRISLVTPPAVVGASATVRPPEYAAALDAARTGFVSGEMDLGPGTDGRALVGPVVAGSEVELTVRLNKPVPGPEEDKRAWLAAALPGVDPAEAFGEDLRIEAEGSQWRLSWTALRAARVPISVTDAFGLGSVEEAAYSFEVVEDRAPTATVTEPAEDEAVLATAVVELIGEGRDDVGLASVSLERQRARPPIGSIGAPAEAFEEPVMIERREVSAGAGGAAAAQATVSATIDLAPLELKAGDEVWVTAVAADVYAFRGQSHEPVRSVARKLRVIAEDQLIEQIRTDLGGLRRAAMQMDEEQAELAEAAEDGIVTEDERRRQSALGQRIGQQGEQVRRLQERVERNRLQDPSLSGMLEDVRSLLNEAQRGAAEAAAAMDEAAKEAEEREPEEERPEAEMNEAQRARADEGQDRVRDRLGQIVRMLDRGEDGWLARRSVERLLEQQRALQRQTARAGEQTLGREAQELTPQERGELERIAERQRELSEQAEKALSELGERAEQLKQADPAQAAAMAEAAQRGREQQVPRTLQEAAENVQQNRTADAQAQQQQAVEALEQMLEDLERAERNRDEQLRRVLASLIESLAGLIAQQERELEAFEQAKGAGAFTGLDSGMIRLNQNTLGVLDQSRQAGAEGADITEMIDRAARAQSAAIVALRLMPVDAEATEAGERESLRLLKLAHEAAQKLEEEARQRDQQRQLAALRRAYRDALEQQVALRADVTPFLGREVNRRERMEVRGLGERQETLRAAMSDLRASTADLADAAVFLFAHERLDTVMGSASKRLRSGEATMQTAREQDSAVRILQGLLEALSESQQQDEFREQGGEEGGSGQGQGSGEQPLIPNMAELKLLRAMQQEAADLTRALHEAGAGAGADEIDAVGRLQRRLAEHGEELIREMGTPPMNAGGGE